MTLPAIPGYHLQAALLEEEDAVIYRAIRARDRRPVLLKTTRTEYPSPEELRRLNHEYEATREASFAGRLQALGLERHRQRTVLVLEAPDAQPLSALLGDSPLNPGPFLEAAIPLARLVGAMHEDGIVHHDLRPGRLFLGAEDAFVIGLGLAGQEARPEGENGPGVASHASLGYLSPERTGRTGRPVDHRADLYSLGVIFYELLVGTRPFTHADPAELVHAHVAQRPVPPDARRPGVPVVVSDLVMKLLAKDAADRYQSAYGLVFDLERCLLQLRSGGAVEPFPLGERDASDQLLLPDKLYGRDEEARALRLAFERAYAGASEVVLVAGPPGIGKTSFVRPLRAHAAQWGGYFVAGKFDQLQRSMPYSALIQVCQDLIRQLLTESDEALARWKDHLLAEMGPVVQVIVGVVPELALVVGEQPPPPAVPPIEAQNRFNRAWQKFLGAFAREAHPLTVFLDDLQWADAATLTLIQNQMTSGANRHLLLVGAYRDGDVGDSHPLRVTVQVLEEAGVPVAHLTLGPLGEADVTALLSDALRAEPAAVEPLGDALWAKTQGNPLAVAEMLRLLHQQRFLVFDAGRHAWDWDLDRIRAVEFSKNVVDLMIGKIRRLAPSVQATLELASCVGHTFEASTLAAVSGRSVEATVGDLVEAAEEGLILFASQGAAPPDTCRFLHDRVQQAAYALIEEPERASAHLRVGRALAAIHSPPDAEVSIVPDRLFDVVDHLNLGAAHIDDAEERLRLAGLNLQACRRAKAATAFKAALGYASAGLALLDAAHWEAAYALMLDLHLEQAEGAYLIGQFERAEALCEEILGHARTDGDRALVANLRIILYTSQSRYADAVRVGVEAGRLLGLALPEAPTQLDIVREFMRARWNLRGMRAEDLIDLPPRADTERLSPSDLLMNLMSPAFLSDEVFAIMTALKLLNRSLTRGVSKATPFGLMIYAVVNAGLGKPHRARAFGEMALELREMLPHVEKGHILPFLFATAINHWTAPATSNLDLLWQGYRASLDAGDLVYADFCLITVVVNACFTGAPLGVVLERCDQYVDFFTRVKRSGATDTVQRQTATIQRQHARCLRGQTDGRTVLSDGQFDEEAFLATPKAPLLMLELLIKKMQLLYLYDDIERLADVIEQGAAVIKEVRITGDVRVSELVFYKALALASMPPTLGRRRALRADRRQLKRWAVGCPANFQHMHLLVEAECARAAGRERRAMDLYDAAIAAAEEHGFIHIQALANERAARFYERMGRDAVARAYAAEAQYGYAQWGATAKVEALGEHFGGSLPALASFEEAAPSAAERVDLASVVKASRALSEEIILDQLLERMGGILIENAGAEKGYLVLNVDGRLVVEAEAAVEGSGRLLAGSEPLKSTHLLPRSVVLYVTRTRETVVLHDAPADRTFGADPYIARHRPRSVLCLPLLHQGRLTGALYLENTLATGAFTPSRLEVLRLLSAQLSTSIENARLYRNLERQVADRTDELRQKNADLEAAMRHLQTTQTRLVQAEKLASLGALTAGIAHEIKNPLNFVNNFAGLTRELVEDLREESDPDEVQAILTDLELNAAKIEEHGKRADGIVRAMMEHAREGGAGPRQPVELNSLIDEYVGLAYRGRRARTPDFEVAIEKQWDEQVGQVAVVPQEIGRVVLNLISNAFDAVADHAGRPGEPYAPSVTVATRRRGDAVEVRVADNGPGIPESVRARIFEPFFTTKPSGSGTGLGLSMSYDIVVQGHDGELSAESGPDGGAVFVARLPAPMHEPPALTDAETDT